MTSVVDVFSLSLCLSFSPFVLFLFLVVLLSSFTEHLKCSLSLSLSLSYCDHSEISVVDVVPSFLLSRTLPHSSA